MTWQKSSYSGQNGACIEIRGDFSALRDSKNTGGQILQTAGLRQLVLFAKKR
jgi:hypothetical protein